MTIPVTVDVNIWMPPFEAPKPQRHEPTRPLSQQRHVAHRRLAAGFLDSWIQSHLKKRQFAHLPTHQTFTNSRVFVDLLAREDAILAGRSLLARC